MFVCFINSIFIHDLFKQIILGLIQGLTEFLPISSTAHLVIFPKLLGWSDPGVTTIASLQLGSMVAVYIYFWDDINHIFKGFKDLVDKKKITTNRSKLALCIFIGNIPIILGGIFIKLFWSDYEKSIFRSPLSIALISILMACILALAERSGKKYRDISDINFFDSLFIGLFQFFAIIPGVSRSGATISASLFSGINRTSAAKYSFLLGIPIISLVGLVEFKTAISEFNLNNLFLLIVGIISASIASFFSIGFLIKFLSKNSIMVFVYYRLIFGSAIIFTLLYK